MDYKKYKVEDIDKIVGFKTWDDRRKTDTLLYIDCNQYCNLGKESSKKEREAVKKISRKIYTAIKKINPPMGTSFLQSIDKTE
tara:strand:- start:14449 stop:14697 length:249 start_codon:yes stop_codon:yes gene_type:complete